MRVCFTNMQFQVDLESIVFESTSVSWSKTCFLNILPNLHFRFQCITTCIQNHGRAVLQTDENKGAHCSKSMLHFFGIAPRITTANVKKQMTPAKKKMPPSEIWNSTSSCRAACGCDFRTYEVEEETTTTCYPRFRDETRGYSTHWIARCSWASRAAAEDFLASAAAAVWLKIMHVFQAFSAFIFQKRL